MLKKIALAIIVLLAAFFIYAATKPDAFRVQRSATMLASPETISALINDFHQWKEWSPYEKLDPALKKTYKGPANGKGAIYEWDGNNKAGQGRMEIIETSPSKIVIRLNFIKPFESENTAAFTLNPQGPRTNITWEMYGPLPYISKVMSIFFDMDQMIGQDFEKGLANLKTVAESKALDY